MPAVVLPFPCPECLSPVPVAPGESAPCPKCGTRFRRPSRAGFAPAESPRPSRAGASAAATPSPKEEAPDPWDYLLYALLGVGAFLLGALLFVAADRWIPLDDAQHAEPSARADEST